MDRSCSPNGGKRQAYILLVRNPEGKRPLERPRRGREDNIKLNLSETEWGGMNWIVESQDRDKCRALVNAIMNLQVP
jgi:hypothetical protein